MSKHIDTKHKVKEICNIKDFEQLLELAILSDMDKQIMRMIYVKENDVNFIADTLDLVPATVYKRHNKILAKLRKLI